MKRLLVSQLNSQSKTIELDPEEAKHAIQVLRLRNGEELEILDGRGHAARGKLRLAGKRNFVEIEQFEAASPTLAQASIAPVTLEIAVLKGAAMEWAIEKAVELGVRTLAPLLTAHTVVQMDHKGPDLFQKRWQKIADQALKQCGRLYKMEILPPQRIEERLAQASTLNTTSLWCDETSTTTAPSLMGWLLENQKALQQPRHQLHLWIGPEGGWSENEQKLLRASFQNVSLGSLILRAETAALFSASLATAFFHQLGKTTQLDNNRPIKES